MVLVYFFSSFFFSCGIKLKHTKKNAAYSDVLFLLFKFERRLHDKEDHLEIMFYNN